MERRALEALWASEVPPAYQDYLALGVLPEALLALVGQLVVHVPLAELLAVLLAPVKQLSDAHTKQNKKIPVTV